MKKRYLVILLLCLMIIPLVGCSKKSDTTTPKVVPLTPMQVLTNRVNASDAKDLVQDQSIVDLSNRITTEIGAITQVDLSPINARLGILEALNISDLQDQIASLTYQLTISESKYTTLNTSFYAHLANSSSPTPSPTPNGSTPTPTPAPTPTPSGILTKPVAIYPPVGNMSVPNGSVIFQWTDCNASIYEFWIGNNSNNMVLWDELDSDIQSFSYPATDANTYYFWRIRAIVGSTVKSSSFWFKTQ